MKKVFTAENIVMTGFIKSLLESANIQCVIKNLGLSGAIGEIPPIECWPEIWIMNDDDFKEAMEIIKSVNNNRVNDNLWTCSCGELIEGQFDSCWSCGREKSDNV